MRMLSPPLLEPESCHDLLLAMRCSSQMVQNVKFIYESPLTLACLQSIDPWLSPKLEPLILALSLVATWPSASMHDILEELTTTSSDPNKMAMVRLLPWAQLVLALPDRTHGFCICMPAAADNYPRKQGSQSTRFPCLQAALELLERMRASAGMGDERTERLAWVARAAAAAGDLCLTCLRGQQEAAGEQGSCGDLMATFCAGIPPATLVAVSAMEQLSAWAAAGSEEQGLQHSIQRYGLQQATRRQFMLLLTSFQHLIEQRQGFVGRLTSGALRRQAVHLASDSLKALRFIKQGSAWHFVASCNVGMADLLPSLPLTSGPQEPLPGALPPGKTRRGPMWLAGRPTTATVLEALARLTGFLAQQWQRGGLKVIGLVRGAERLGLELENGMDSSVFNTAAMLEYTYFAAIKFDGIQACSEPPQQHLAHLPEPAQLQALAHALAARANVLLAHKLPGACGPIVDWKYCTDLIVTSISSVSTLVLNRSQVDGGSEDDHLRCAERRR